MIKHILYGVAIIVVMTHLFGCGNQKNAPDTTDRVIHFEKDDQEMTVAIARAKKEWSYFVSHWKDKDVSYSVKFAVTGNNDKIEHIWFTPISIDGMNITAKCANNPEMIEGLKAGMVKVMKTDDISDWMIIQNGKCHGGYTLRVILKREGDKNPPFEFIE